MNTCMIIGSKSIEKSQLEDVKLQLRAEILNAITDGYSHFISGFSDGTELIFAAIVAELKETYEITLEAAIPHRNRIYTKNEEFQRLFFKCNIVGVHTEKYSPSCFANTARLTMGFADCVIVVYNCNKRDNAFKLMKYAQVMGKDIRKIPI